MAVVNNNGMMLQFVSEYLCRYKEIVTAEVKQNPGVLESASEDLRRYIYFCDGFIKAGWYGDRVCIRVPSEIYVNSDGCSK